MFNETLKTSFEEQEMIRASFTYCINRLNATVLFMIMITVSNVPTFSQ